MKCGIIGLPQVGKTSVFRILTRTLREESHPHFGTSQIGVATVPDERLDRLATLFPAPKATHATIEWLDIAALGKDSLKESETLGALRNLDALAHVVRLFPDASIPHLKGGLDPQRDISSVELDLILSDLGVVENRLNKLEKDRKKIPSPELEKEQALLQKARQWLEAEKPLREAEGSPEEKKQLRGFMFLSEKPLLIVLNVGEQEAGEMEEVLETPGLDRFGRRPHARATAVSAKVEAELAEMPDPEAAEFMKSYGLRESGRKRLTRATYDLLGRIAFFTVSEKECRAWSAASGATASQAAGIIHTDLEKNFIRAEVVPWEKLLAEGSLAAARQKGVLRLEGKDYVVQDGDVVYIRHSG